MYKQFFGLRENPFNVNPDPRYLFLSTRTREALDEMTYGIKARKGLILLTGEVGTGKTTLINRLLDNLHDLKTPTAFVFNSHLESSHLLDFVLADFRVPYDSRLSGNPLLRLNQWLIERYSAGDAPVLIVDEAQGLPFHVLEEIRMLLNLETPHQKLLQIVLAGQPELEDRLKRPELRQLKQRIMIRCKTGPLSLEETHEYIGKRLQIAGSNGKEIFMPEAKDAVHYYSGGIPRVVNLLCEHALINAYVEGIQQVPAGMVEEIAREFEYDDIKSPVGTRVFADTLSTRLSELQSTPASAAANLHAAPEPSSPQREYEVAIAGASVPSIEAQTERGRAREDAGLILKCEDLSGLTASDPAALRLDKPAEGGKASELESAKAIRPKGPAESVSDFNLQVIAELEGERARPGFSSAIHVVEDKPKLKDRPSYIAGRVSASPKPAYSGSPENAARSFSSGWRRRPFRDAWFSVARSSVRSTNRLLSCVNSQSWTRLTVPVFGRLNRSLVPVKPIYRRCLAWKDSCVALGRQEWPRMKRSVNRWLQEPWNPGQHSRVFQTRRGLTHKKT